MPARMSVEQEQQQDPEKFGLHILKNQMKMAEAKNILNQAQSKLEKQQNLNLPLAEIEKIQADLQKAKQNYQEAKLNTDIMLAVVGLSSPE
jgi:hypothetical protein